MTQCKQKTTLPRILHRLTASILCCATLMTAALAFDGKVDTSTLNVRSQTSIKSVSIGKVYRDQTVEITGRLGNWYSINYNGKRGFVFVDYLETDSASPIDLSYGTVTASSEKSTVNLREKPTTNSDRLTRLLYGTKVRVLGYTDGWYYVRYVDYYGYISADYLKIGGVVYSSSQNTTGTAVNLSLTQDLPNTVFAASLVETWEPAEALLSAASIETDPTTTTTTASAAATTAKPAETTTAKPAETTTAKPAATTTAKPAAATTAATTTTAKPAETTTAKPASGNVTGQDIVDYAMKFLGIRYVYGGTSPSTGFDCSGLTYYVYKHFGYTLNRVSYAQINNGTKVSKSELRAGDLVFFSRPGYSVGHVGIYIGNGKFIHAPRTGDVVKITSLSESYYVKNYVGARRIIK